MRVANKAGIAFSSTCYSTDLYCNALTALGCSLLLCLRPVSINMFRNWLTTDPAVQVWQQGYAKSAEVYASAGV
jgi:hypothetical protein